jgi:tetratricopeptide (TPR) repeat protein
VSIDIKGYRIFIATPGGLQSERQAFRRAVEEYNTAEAIPRGVLFIPVGWEDVLGGVGRPQSIINTEQVAVCDYFLLMLWDRWGTPPEDGGTYTSGTEEEFDFAMKCLASEATQYPMRQVLAFFKAVDPSKLSDPGPQLEQVLKFKRDLESNRRILHTTFDEIGVFQKHLRGNLGRWVREHETGDLKKAGTVEQSPSAQDRSLELAAPGRNTDPSIDLEQAQSLVSQGRVTEAETKYARVIARGGSPDAFNLYGHFLMRGGRLLQAQVMYERVLELTPSDPTWQASAYSSLGLIYRIRGDHSSAEQMFRKSLEIETRLNRLEGMADQYANIGMILKRRGDLDQAEQMEREALALNQQLNRIEGQAIAYCNLGVISRKRDDLPQAEEFLRRSLELGRQCGSLTAMARAYGNLGVICLARNEIDKAELMFNKSLGANRELDSLVGIATQYGYLGLVYKEQGEFDRAKEMFLQSVELNEKLGSTNGLAKQYANLGFLWAARKDRAKAIDFWTKARDLFNQSGLPKKVQEMSEALERIGRESNDAANP